MEQPDDLAVLTGTVLAVCAAVRELIIELPQDSPVRTKLREAQSLQERVLREQERPASVLFA